MIAYKGFDADLQARWGSGTYRYEAGKTYKEDRSKCASSGFHCAENPIDCLKWYPLGAGNRYFLVEASGSLDETTGDSKIACTQITLLKISIHTAFAGCDSKSHQFFLTNLDTLISYSTHSLQQINPSSHILLFFLLFLLLISVRMSWGFYVRLGFARWYAFGVAFFVSRRFPELLFVSSSSSGFGSIFENAGC